MISADELSLGFFRVLDKSKFDRYKAEQDKKHQSELNGSESGDESRPAVRHHRHKKDKRSYDNHGHSHRGSKKHRSSPERDGSGYDDRNSASVENYTDHDKTSSGDRHHKHKKHRSRSPIAEAKSHRHKEKSRYPFPSLQVFMYNGLF